MSEPADLPLFMWAASRPSAEIIDARQRFLARETAFYRLLMIGWVPPASGGADPIDLRKARAMRRGPSQKVACLSVEEAANA